MPLTGERPAISCDWMPLLREPHRYAKPSPGRSELPIDYLMLVAIEGIDAAGKNTQAGLLRARAEASGLSAAVLSFPRYGETRYAQFVADYLNGAYGDLGSVGPHFAG